MSIPRKRLSIEERIGEAGSTLYMHWLTEGPGHSHVQADTTPPWKDCCLVSLPSSLETDTVDHQRCQLPLPSQARWAVYIFPTLSHGDGRILCLRSHQQKGARRWTRRTIHASDLSPRDLLVSAKGNRDLWYKCIQTIVR